jgi:hypothetical protein
MRGGLISPKVSAEKWCGKHSGLCHLIVGGGNGDQWMVAFACILFAGGKIDELRKVGYF